MLIPGHKPVTSHCKLCGRFQTEHDQQLSSGELGFRNRGWACFRLHSLVSQLVDFRGRHDIICMIANELKVHVRTGHIPGVYMHTAQLVQHPLMCVS